MNENDERPVAGRFFAELPKAIVYPVKGPGKYMLLGGAIVFAAVQTVLAWGGGSLIGAAAAAIGFLFLGGYICAYLLKVIGSTAGGDREMPDWPDITDPLDDVVRPALFVAGSAAISLLPYLAYAFLHRWKGQSYNETLAMVLLAAGCLYLPMGLLSVALHESLAGMNPLIVVVAIARIPLPYLCACALMLLVGLFAVYVAPLLAVSWPIVGAVISQMLFLYFITVQMRIIGLLYAGYSKRLDWFPED